MLIYTALVYFLPKTGKHTKITNFFIDFYSNIAIKAVNLAKHTL